MKFMHEVWKQLYWRERQRAGQDLLTPAMMSGMTMMMWAERAYRNLEVS